MSLYKNPFIMLIALRLSVDAGWSSPVARQAHNLKVVGSNPTPATNDTDIKWLTIGTILIRVQA
jgi:hypothetical protein